MSMCNMSIEGGARAGMVAPDDVTFAYLKGRPLAPKGEVWDRAEAYWRTLRTDEGAKFDIEVNIRGEDIVPTVTWGTSPQDVVPITGAILTYNTAIGLLNHLCSLIPRDRFTPMHLPQYSGEFESTLHLPSSLPLPPEHLIYIGPPRRTKKEAKRARHTSLGTRNFPSPNKRDDSATSTARTASRM